MDSDDPFRPYVATPVKYRRVALIVWTNRIDFQVITETGQTGQLEYDGTANGGHLFCPEDIRQIGPFGTCNALLCPKVNHLNDMEYNHTLPPYSSALINVSSHLYVACNELRSPG